MSVVQFVSESYNAQNTIRANAGDWVDGIVTFQTLFQVGSGTADSLTYVENATTASLVFQQTDFDEQGFMVGDSITITWTEYPSGVAQSEVRIINYVSGGQIQLNSGLPSSIGNGAVFPTDGALSGMSIVADKRPNAIEFFFNLTPNGTNSLGSVVDTSLTRLQLEDTDTIVISTPTAMVQVGDASGSYIKDILLEYVADAGNGWKDWKLTFTFIQWGFIKDGFTTDNPPYYDGIDHIAPLNRVKAFAEFGNPNGIIIGNTQNTQANTGGFDENYNGGNSLYTVISTSWVDALNNPIDSLDYSGECKFTAVISAPGQVDPTSTYNLGLIWRPTDGTYYQERIPSLANNLLLLAPDNDFIADAVTDATVYPGFPYIGDLPGLNTDGAQWDLKDVNIELTAANEVTIIGTIVPNAAAAGLFVDVPNGGRKSTVWVSIGDFTTDGANNSKRVSLKLWDQDNYDAPTIGVQIPDIEDQNLFDHDGNDIDVPLPQTTTEDDVLYITNFKLLDDLPYEGIRLRITAFNTVTEEQFTLEEPTFISFTNVPFVGGIFEVNYLQSRNFNLPPTSDRNHISLVRNAALDGGGKYGLTLEYGWLNDWRYWIENASVDDDFFDYTVPDEFNGKNANWQTFSDSGDWITRVEIFTRLDGVDDFNYYEVGIRPYEDDAVTAVTNFTVLSTGATPNALVNNELIEIETIFNWPGFLFTNEWVEFTVENFENGNRWVMSSVLDQGNIANNPLKPIAGLTVIQALGTGTDTLTCKANIDTNLISVNEVSLSFRVFSDDTAGFDYLLTILKEAERAYSLRKLSDNSIYPDASPCIRVRRTLDNAELDIGFTSNVLDTAAMETFVTNSGGDPTGAGYVVTWFDQGGNGQNATQATLANQPQIVRLGVTIVDPQNGFPAVEFDGSNDFLGFPNAANTEPVCTLSVINRASTGINSIPLGYTLNTSPVAPLWNTSNSVRSMIGSTVNVHGTDSNTGDFLLIYNRETVGFDNVMRLNGSALTTQVDSTINGLFFWNAIGKRSSNHHNGLIQETVLYMQNKESEFAALELNVNNFYGIY